MARIICELENGWDVADNYPFIYCEKRPRDIVRIADAAKYTRIRMMRLYEYALDGELTFYYYNGIYYFNKEDLLKVNKLEYS